MDKIAIIGSPGSGKSTLAQQLGESLNIEIIHLDRYFWQSNWREKPRDTRIEILNELVRKERWIIEGTYLGSSEPRLNAADTIIFLDIPPLVCLWRLTKRHLQSRGQPRPDLPDGCSDNLTLICVLKALNFPIRGRRTIKQKLRSYKSKQIIQLRSRKKVEAFLAQVENPSAQQKQGADEKRYASSTVPVAIESLLVATTGQ
jgi:adenylate kinase family enzyme